MTPRLFWIAATGILAILLGVAYWTASDAIFPAVAWTFFATFIGAAAGAMVLLVLRGNPLATMAATLGRSVVSILGVVVVWLFLEPPAKPTLGAFVIGYFVFLGLETALALGQNVDGG